MYADALLEDEDLARDIISCVNKLLASKGKNKRHWNDVQGSLCNPNIYPRDFKRYKDLLQKYDGLQELIETYFPDSFKTTDTYIARKKIIPKTPSNLEVLLKVTNNATKNKKGKEKISTENAESENAAFVPSQREEYAGTAEKSFVSPKDKDNIDKEPELIDPEGILHDYFYDSMIGTNQRTAPPLLLSHARRDDSPETGFFAVEKRTEKKLFLNVHNPFCFIALGVQGKGKSHTCNVVLENCLLPFPAPTSDPIVKLECPLAPLVLHYDRVEANLCESTGLARPVNAIKTALQKLGPSNTSTHIQTAVILVSPANLKARKKYYSSELYEVKPLLFSWNSLDANQLRKLMRVDETGTQLYINVLLEKLRGYQRKGYLPQFNAFCKEMLDEITTPSQQSPLKQRINLLQEFIVESDKNKAMRKEHTDLIDHINSGVLVVADLTDPMLTSMEANSIFDVIVGQYRLKPLRCGKVLVCDEAHKYFGTNTSGKEGLSRTVVETARLMRHEGMRIIISTQSPCTMPPELLELATGVACHGFHSRDWYIYLASKLPLPEQGFQTVQSLSPGEALFYSNRSADLVDNDDLAAGAPFVIKVRPRITQDRGQSRTNGN